MPRGYITVTSNKGVVLAKGIINPESDLILPGTTKQFSPKLQTISAVKNIKQYRVTAYYRYDGQTAFTTRTLIVDGLAWLKPAVVIGVVGLVVAAVGWRYRRRFMPKPRYTI